MSNSTRISTSFINGVTLQTTHSRKISNSLTATIGKERQLKEKI